MTAHRQQNPKENPLQKLRQPLIPDRIRRINGQSFAFILHRFLRDGFLQILSRDQLALYVFLVLAANREGVSFYRYDAICSILALSLDDYIAARNSLIHMDLIAFDGSRFQVLSLPDEPPTAPRPPLTSPEDMENHDPATIRATILSALENTLGDHMADSCPQQSSDTQDPKGSPGNFNLDFDHRH